MIARTLSRVDISCEWKVISEVQWYKSIHEHTQRELELKSLWHA